MTHNYRVVWEPALNADGTVKTGHWWCRLCETTVQRRDKHERRPNHQFRKATKVLPSNAPSEVSAQAALRALVQHAVAQLSATRVGPPPPADAPYVPPWSLPTEAVTPHYIDDSLQDFFAPVSDGAMEMEPTAQERAEERAADAIDAILAMEERLRLYDTDSDDEIRPPSVTEAADGATGLDTPLNLEGTEFVPGTSNLRLPEPSLTEPLRNYDRSSSAPKFSLG